MIMLWLYVIATATARSLADEPKFIYFVLVDRFANGDLTNDVAVDLTDPHAFHGGDLNGVTQHLNHLQNLGVDTIWLSPIFSMRTEKFMGHGAFHGYWVQHLDDIEPAFGGTTALEGLISATQTRNMTILMDMVYNHVSFDSPMRSAHPDWFHPEHPIEDWNDPYQLTHYQVHGLPDLNQARPPVYQYLYHRSQHWQQLGIGGYRIDAIRHLENSFLKKISTDLHQSVGLDFWLLGEDFQGNPVALAERAKETGLDALFDFPMYYGMIDTFCNDSPSGRLAALLSMDRNYPTSLDLVTFLDNHDLPRIMSACKSDESRVLQALTFQFGIRGIPMLTYGTEALLEGKEEPSNRGDMQWEAPLPAYDWIKTLYAYRKAHPALHAPKYGQTILLNQDMWVYEANASTERALIIWNTSKEEQPLDLVQTDDQNYKIGWHASKNLKELSSLPTKIKPGIAVLVFNTPSEATSNDHSNSTLEPVEETIEIQLHHEPIDGTLLMVGSDPALGGWNPNNAPQFQTDSNGVSLKLSLPKNAVLNYKLVLISNDQIEWEKGSNRYLWLNEDKDLRLSKIQLY